MTRGSTKRRGRARRGSARSGVLRTAAAVLGGFVVLTVALLVAGFMSIAHAGSGAASTTRVASNPCPAASPVVVGSVTVPRGPVAGYCQAQLVNAAEVINAARSLGIGTHTQTVGVMTAIGETRLRNLDYGDAAGPDSRGLFQQRDNGLWGTYAQRMDPYTASLHFYEKLVTIPGWRTMQPTLLAHAVQVNSDPYYYAQFWGDAQTIVAALTQ
ncbi:MAG: hypothetical protein FWD85_03380 [Microbacteriaceae bacterium]|nr:hypothetical protein [Microbacteriaceae bacterium]MCL2794332.1 hypothetical protein [Microbacteriaceae bacterium]